MKSYARALALWWTYLHAFSLAWDALSIADVGGFLAGLRTGDGPQVPSIEPRESRFAESTISTRLRAVTSFYRFHEMNGVSLGGDLVKVVHGGRSAYKPMLEHVARKKGRQRAVIRVSTARTAPAGADARADRRDLRRVRVAGRARAVGRPGPGPLPVVAARGDGPAARRGAGAPAPGLAYWPRRHPFVEVVPRDHPHGVRVKGSRYRRLFVSDELDRLYGEYLWQLCDAGADLAVPDMDAAHVFVNLAGGTRFAPWRPESVYDLVKRLRRDLAGHVPQTWSPHWMRHSHATALLLAGVRCTWCRGDWVTPTSRQPWSSTGMSPRTRSCGPSRGGRRSWKARGHADEQERHDRGADDAEDRTGQQRVRLAEPR